MRPSTRADHLHTQNRVAAPQEGECTCLDVTTRNEKKGSLVFVFLILHLLCHKQKTQKHMSVGKKGGIQGWCKWVCFHYMCVIMGMWCRVCTTCIKAVFACLCVWECVCVWPSYATHYITNLCKPPQEKQSETVRLRPERHQRGRGTCDTACQPSTRPDELYSYKLCSVRPAPHWLSCAAWHTHLRSLQITQMPCPLRPPFALWLIDAVSHAI